MPVVEQPKTRVLITVKTYPHPSEKYEELVCTAGITADGEWVRLYPVNYRYRPRIQMFEKYQWIDVELEPRGDGNDGRRESRKPRLDSIEIASERLPTDDDWRARRAIIDPMPHHTMKELWELYERDYTSLGIVRPKIVRDLLIEDADREWKPKWKNLYNQLRLFGDPPKPLTKLPFNWTYIFECEDSDRPHRAMMGDWELGVLFLKLREGHEERRAAEMVRDKFLGELCASDRDTRLFVGTRWPYNVWMVLGVFWPPVIRQPELPL